MRSIEIFYNFMTMDANRNVLRRNPDEIPESQLARMDAIWGDRSWHTSAYATSKQLGLFEDIKEKADIEAIAEAFRKRLGNIAGLDHVPEPLPMRNTKEAILYYLFSASPNKTGAKIVQAIFDKYRSRGVR
jgi:three-Cys-motif partner protein